MMENGEQSDCKDRSGSCHEKKRVFEKKMQSDGPFKVILAERTEKMQRQQSAGC